MARGARHVAVRLSREHLAGEAPGHGGVDVALRRHSRVEQPERLAQLRTTHEHIRACLKLFAERPEIVEAHRVTGEDCFILEAIVPVPGDLALLVDAVGPFGAVTTCVMLKSEPVKPLGRALLAAGRRRT